MMKVQDVTHTNLFINYQQRQQCVLDVPLCLKLFAFSFSSSSSLKELLRYWKQKGQRNPCHSSSHLSLVTAYGCNMK